MKRDLLYRFFEGQTSPEEEKHIRRWVELSEENHKILLQERVAYDALMLTPSKTVKKRKRVIELSPWAIGAVASVMLLLIAGGWYVFGQKNDAEQYNTLLVPAGQRINLILADNTNVWLNANTTFRYPTEFSKKNRTVYLDGEAYFDVSKNKKKPFIVKTTQGDVQVTGTTFNVEAYSRFNHFETSLFEGGIDIYKNNTKLISLKPNEKSSLDNNKLRVSRITNTDDYLWKDGLIAFNNRNLEEILHSLEKYFDVRIQINSKKLPQHTYTGKFRQSDGIDYALRVLQKSIRFAYEKNEETGIISIN